MKEIDSPDLSDTLIHISSKSHLNLTFNLLQCGLREILPDEQLSVGAGDTFTLFYIQEGLGVLETNGMGFRAGGGQGFFAFPDARYELKNISDTSIKMVWLSFTGYLVEHYLNRANIGRRNPVFSDSSFFIREKMKFIYHASQILPNRYCRMMSALYDIFSSLLDANPTRPGEYYDDNSNFYALKAVEYIENSYAKAIATEDIAVVLGISRKHLYAVFNDILKISPKQYLIYYRIEKACMRLKTTGQSVREIAESVGYSNQFYFAKEFKRLVGQTPSAYRKHPGKSEIFSYRSFVPTLRESLSDHSLDLPVSEQILSVYSAPRPLDS